MTQKELRRMIELGAAKDGNLLSKAEVFALSYRSAKIGESRGAGGVNGLLVMDEVTGELFAFAGRSEALLMVSPA